MRSRANLRQRRRADIPRMWCAWGRHETVPLDHVKEHYPAGTVCLTCQLKMLENLLEVISFPDVSLTVVRQERLNREAAQRKASFEKRMKRVNPDASGIVYYMRINGQIKIGYTTDLTQRSRNYPPGTELLAVEPATRYTERDRHQQFHRSRVRGREWFEETQDLVDHIEELADLHGVPKHLMHKFTEARVGT